MSAIVPFTVVIPARYGSTRLPGKPLALLAGKPMIQHVVERAHASAAQQVIVATDDHRVADVVTGFGAKVCLTAASHASGTDRIHEVSQQLGLADDAIVVNVQGDEPLIPPAVINQVAANLADHPPAAAATLSEPVSDREVWQNPNVVKVVTDSRGYALYFSRATIPYPREGVETLFSTDFLPQRHLGIYSYRVSLLQKFVRWPMADLERVECLEQLRILANGHRIHVAPACEPVPGGIDTPEDLAQCQRLLEEKL